MEYFTLPEELEKNRGLRYYAGKRAFIFSGVLFLLFAARALGVLDVEFNKAYFRGNQTAKREVYKVYNDGENYEESNYKSNSGTNVEQSNWYLSLLSDAPTLFSNDKMNLENSIKSRIAEEITLKRRFESSVISIKKVETSGLYWLPLVKHGKTSYQISVKNKISEGDYAADFSGEIDFGAYGICTIAKLKKTVAEQIAAKIVDSIKNDYKK